MLSEDAAKQIVHGGALTKTAQLLVCLGVGDHPKSVAEVRAIAKRVGIPAAKNLNISPLLSGSGARAIHTDLGWELAAAGRTIVEKLAGPLLQAAPPKAATSLRSYLSSISDSDTRSFVEESIVCLERKLYRAAVVLAWVGAVSLLYEHLVEKHLGAFNAEATKRNRKWKAAKTRDDLARMKEYDFLQVLETLSVVGKSVKGELEGCLKLRNGCGHPNSLQIAEHRVSSHIEVLTLNVFAKF